MEQKAPEPLKSSRSPKTPRTLAVDIGGSGIKAVVLDAGGTPIKSRIRVKTPRNSNPRKVIAAVCGLADEHSGFERVSVGFPGVIKEGVVYTAANLGRDWVGFDLAQNLKRQLKRPVRVANDAEVQGLGCINSSGLELVVTLGTGFGSAMFNDGHPFPLELAHHPFRKGKTYEDELGRRALDKKGHKKWNRLLADAIEDLRRTFNFDLLYIGCGNAKAVTLQLPQNTKLISNEAGLLGGIALWRDTE